MAALVIRRNARMRDSHALNEDEDVDDRPMYLKEFPSESSILKDLKLGVLLGRYWFWTFCPLRSQSCVRAPVRAANVLILIPPKSGHG